MQVIDDHFPVYSPAVENGSEYSFLFWLDTFQCAGDSTGEDTFRLEKDHPGGQIKHLDIIHVDDCIQAGDSDFFPIFSKITTYMTFLQMQSNLGLSLSLLLRLFAPQKIDLKKKKIKKGVYDFQSIPTDQTYCCLF